MIVWNSPAAFQMCKFVWFSVTGSMVSSYLPDGTNVYGSKGREYENMKLVCWP